MQNPPHSGELVRESVDDIGWNVTKTAARLRCERATWYHLLNGEAGVAADTALALEDIGLGTVEHGTQMQASYELSHARRARAATGRHASERCA